LARSISIPNNKKVKFSPYFFLPLSPPNHRLGLGLVANKD
jgi:hypothetical protein